MTFTVLVRGDELNEPDETFRLRFAAITPLGLGLPSGEALGTILEDDPEPVLTIGNAAVREGDTGVTKAVFVVTLSAASGRTVTVEYGTSDGTAEAGSDYESVHGLLTFAAETGETRRIIEVPVLGDRQVEADETFRLTLTHPVGATLTGGPAVGTILNDDVSPAPVPNHPPSVRILRPADRTMVPFADEIAIEAEAVDPDPGGRVTRVEYFATNPETGEVRSLGAVGSAPFVIAWNEAEAGRYTLTARATDDQGAFKDSDPVEIVVGIACGKVAILGRAGGAEEIGRAHV